MRSVPAWTVLVACHLMGVTSALASRPNIVLIMADDLGWGDVQCFHAASPIATPHIDAMARNGLQFRRFYAASPVCSPTRGSCLTGRHPERYGIHTANDGHLPANEICLATRLRDQGFRTGHFGKWHLGTMTADFSGKGAERHPETNHCTPGMRGFDTWFSTEFAVATWDPYAPANSHVRGRPFDPRVLYWQNGRNVTTPQTGCDSRIIMDQALPFMEDCHDADQPFFVVIWFHAPHAPVVGGPSYRARYAEHTEDQQHYFAAVTAMDEQVGRLRTALRAWQIETNTLVWFCSDNGPEGNPGPQGRSQGSAGPLRGRKRSLYEGGVRVPACVEWPGVVQAATQSDVPCVTSDYFPTLLDLLNIPLPSDRPYDGVSLRPLIENQPWERPQPIAFQFGNQAALSANRYKLVRHDNLRRARSDNGTVPVDEVELYDLQQDPGETTNVADQFPDVVQSMKSTLQQWQASVSE